MNKRMEPYSSPDDRDIGALFDAQNVNTPADLDQQILSQARSAVENSSQKTPSKSSGFRPWFAAAAVAMIAVGIAPQLIRSPESALDTASESKPVPSAPQNHSVAESTFGQALEEVAPDAVVIQETTARKVASPPPQTDNDVGGAAGDTARHGLSETVANETARDRASEVIQDHADDILENEALITVMPVQLGPDISRLTTLAGPSTLRSAHYRSEPAKWIQEIQRLEAMDMLAAAQFEYEEFRKQFPTYKTDYQPPNRSRQ